MFTFTHLFPLFLVFLPIIAVYQSYLEFSPSGKEFRPKRTSQSLLNTTTSTEGECSLLCNKWMSCRTFDYDLVSKRCRLFEGDSTTGSIIVSSSSTSFVGTVIINPSIYTSIHNQPCSYCQYNRYEICSKNTSTCQCPSNTYWNGFICALQLFENDTCTREDMCRSSVNLVCSVNCYGAFEKCSKPVNSKLMFRF